MRYQINRPNNTDKDYTPLRKKIMKLLVTKTHTCENDCPLLEKLIVNREKFSFTIAYPAHKYMIALRLARRKSAGSGKDEFMRLQLAGKILFPRHKTERKKQTNKKKATAYLIEVEVSCCLTGIGDITGDTQALLKPPHLRE